LPCVAELVNWPAFDVLHYQVRAAISRRAAVEETCDVGMLEVREDLSFDPKALNDKVSIHPSLNQFYGDLLPVLIIIASGEIDRSHAPTSDCSQDFVRTDVLVDGRFWILIAE